ncbi:protein of unknown function [uncultured Sphingopyxis sp.]|uniref:Uncharacterized protein n=1 Tax=uncultured Sphingopyxis sp. TaxID=310581 RepID=A0A1Y5PS59_9SPHN|nr:protein of unknown function [uncultured Sphingopyxis sp.]
MPPIWAQLIGKILTRVNIHYRVCE